MTTIQAQRPHFFEGQYLGAADLEAAVEYARLQQARHDLGAHTWGIAAGLQLKEQSLANGQLDLYILPGYAWDGFGRPIVVLAPYKLPAELFQGFVFEPGVDDIEPGGRLVEVWLRYDETQTQSPRRGFEICDPDAPFARVQESFRLEIGRRQNLADRQDRIAVGGYSLYAQESLQHFDPQAPAQTLVDESVAFQQLPAVGERRRWLIPLGIVRWQPNPVSGQPGEFVKRNDDDLTTSRRRRRDAGVVAGAIHAADKHISLRHRSTSYSPVYSDDLVWAEGNLRIDGNLRLFAGKVEWRTQNGLDLGAPLDMRRTTEPATGATMLQIAIGASTNGDNRFSVGPLKGGDPQVVDEKFVILDDGRVGIGTKNPVESLDVRGAIKHGAKGDLFAMGAAQNIRVVTGSVAVGVPSAAGAGFKATRNDVGSYTITFTPPFAAAPVIVASCVNAPGIDNLVTVRSLTAGSFEAIISDLVFAATAEVANQQDSEFGFIAMGAS